MELRHIRYFLAVAEDLSVTRAAARLHMAQPPLSRQIRDLENELGTPLFIRRPRSLELTEAGVLFRQYARQILMLTDKAVQEVRDLNRGLTGTVYIDSTSGKGPELVTGWIAGFKEQSPGIQYSVWNGNTEDVLERLEKGLCDMAVIMAPCDYAGLNHLHICSEPWVAMLPAVSPLAALPGDTLELARLRDCDLILPVRKERMQEFQSWFSATGREPRVICETAHLINAYQLVRQNVGIALSPLSAAIMTDPAQVMIRQLVNPSIMANYELIWRRDRNLSAVAASFLQYIITGTGSEPVQEA